MFLFISVLTSVFEIVLIIGMLEPVRPGKLDIMILHTCAPDVSGSF